MSQTAERSLDNLAKLERELAYYRHEYNELGARLLRSQEEQSEAFREARRARTVAKLIREAINRLGDASLTLDQLEADILEIIVDNTISDAAAFVREEPVGSGNFIVSHAVGLDEPPPHVIHIESVPDFLFTATNTEARPHAAAITAILHLPFVLWAYDRQRGRALIIGNRSEANVNRAFAVGDRQLVEGGLSVYLDVLARKEAELQLHDAKEVAEQARRDAENARAAAEVAAHAKSTFLAAMSHEIRTPMTAVLGMADLLAGERLESRQLEYVEAMRTSGRHLLAIINDILDFSKAEAGHLELDDVAFSLPGLLGEVKSLLSGQATERGLELEFRCTGCDPTNVSGDPTRLRQVLLNLVGNALKFTARGSVTVELRCTQSRQGWITARCEVRDTGAGIPFDRQAQLFEPFFQVDASTARRHGGTGLGLAICKRLVVDAMGGSLGVDSEPGHGSLFWFEVPLATTAMAAAVPRAQVPDVATGRPLRVLVAEDAPLSRALLEAMLTRFGHDVAFAVDGVEAVQMAESGRYDLILMDIHMPVVDGVEATRRIRRLAPPASAIPICGLTANVMEDQRDGYLEAGINQILNKPIDWSELLAVFSEIAAKTEPVT